VILLDKGGRVVVSCFSHMESSAESETLKALQAAKDKCVLDLKRLDQTMNGLKTKMEHTRARLEMAEEMLAIAKGSSQTKKPA
jgi:hypothetical protein